jgi:DNA-binding transcriptional regulator GbsR (MarR family)
LQKLNNLSISFEISEIGLKFEFLKRIHMKLAEAKQQFIASWGAFGTHWGINRTMAQIHALLLVSPDPLSQDDLMEQLNVSRGNANMNIRELIDWGLVDRVIIPGERKEYFLESCDPNCERKKEKRVESYVEIARPIGKCGRR